VTKRHCRPWPTRPAARFYRATDTDSLEKIYEQINRLEKPRKPYRSSNTTMSCFLGADPLGVPARIWLLLQHTRFRRLP